MFSAAEISEGYTIIEKFVVGEQGFALGENLNAPSPYVTWQFRADAPTDYFWGHYTKNKGAAYQDYEMRIDDEVQSISERTGQKPLLPALCWTVNPATGDLINIKRGVSGYCESSWNSPGNEQRNRATADHQNQVRGITKAQESAMLNGSIIGWDCKLADPRSYDEHGVPVPPQKKKHNKSHER